MGPFSEDLQLKRANAIARLLEDNPQLDDSTRRMWERKLLELCHNEETYNYRVKTVYQNIRKGITL